MSKSPVSSRSDFSGSTAFTYPAKLVSGGQKQLDSGNWRLALEFERHDRVWADGNPVKAYSNALTTIHGGNDPMWEGSPSDVITASFENVTGGALNVLDDESLKQFFGHSFMLTDELETNADGSPRTYTDKNGRERNSYIVTATEYLGPDFEYTGKVTNAGGNSAAAPEPDAADTLALCLHGYPVDTLRDGEALNLVKECAELADVKNVLGKPLRGALVKPRAPLIDALINQGYAEVDEDGIFRAVAFGVDA